MSKNKMKSSRLYLFLLLFSLTTGAAMVNPINGLQKVGEAKLEILFWDIYTSELFSASGRYQKDIYPIALKIKYLRNIDAADLIDKTLEEWLKLGITKKQAKPWLSQLQELWPNIKKRDELLLLVNEDKSSEFFFNGESLGQLDDSEFGSSFLRIWLDENCSYPKLRKKLIGEDS
ncbi:MAG: hypothetical protein ACI808_000063 [Paraglaciecola sp.]|jgi:hypothetical protein